MIFTVLMIGIIVFCFAAFWTVFTKANQPGWGCIIPIYNFILILRIAGKPGWWFFLCLIPLVNIVILIMIYIALAKNFGKGGGFAAGLLLLPFIFFPMLAWGDARYSPQH